MLLCLEMQKFRGRVEDIEKLFDLFYQCRTLGSRIALYTSSWVNEQLIHDQELILPWKEFFPRLYGWFQTFPMLRSLLHFAAYLRSCFQVGNCTLLEFHRRSSTSLGICKPLEEENSRSKQGPKLSGWGQKKFFGRRWQDACCRPRVGVSFTTVSCLLDFS